jgi:hypothetical protein
MRRMPRRFEPLLFPLTVLFAVPAAHAETASGTALVDTGADGTAEEPMRPESGFEHGLRVGFSVAAGESTSGRSMSDTIATRVPVWVDIGYRLDRSLYLAAFGQVGLDGAGDGCQAYSSDGSASCTAEDWRLGAEVLLHVFGAAKPDLWLGVGLGWEHVNETSRFVADIDPSLGVGDQAAATIDEVTQGPFLELQAGLDFPVDGKLRAGPFATYAAGTFVSRSFDCSTGAACPDSGIDDAAIHHFVTLGARGSFGP